MSITTPFQLESLLALVSETPEPMIARYAGFVMRSHFQPIYSFAHRRVVGHEGLMRPQTDGGKVLAPYTVFASARSEAELITLDRLSRLLHAKNFVAASQHLSEPPPWLFVNAEPNAFTHAGQHGRFFPEMLTLLDIEPRRVVIEVLETAIEDNRALRRAVDYFREIGCLIAIDDFGAGHSNVDRVWRLRPDIVKLDRSLISEATSNSDARLILPSLVSLLHESGALVLAEGVEAESEALVALEADCDLVQGFFFARPEPHLLSADEAHPHFNMLWQHFNTHVSEEIDQTQRYLSPFVAALLKGAAMLSDGASFKDAADQFMLEPTAIRCFLLDNTGRQVGANLLSDTPLSKASRFSSLDNSDGAVWSRRHYFRQAMKRFGELQVSRPYLSIVGEQQCITLSLGILIRDQRHVFCGDLRWQGATPFDDALPGLVE